MQLFISFPISIISPHLTHHQHPFYNKAAAKAIATAPPIPTWFATAAPVKIGPVDVVTLPVPTATPLVVACVVCAVSVVSVVAAPVDVPETAGVEADETTGVVVATVETEVEVAVGAAVEEAASEEDSWAQISSVTSRASAASVASQSARTQGSAAVVMACMVAGTQIQAKSVIAQVEALATASVMQETAQEGISAIVT